MTNIRSAIAKGAVLTMAVLKTCHGFYVPGVRPHEFISGEDVPMKVNAMTSVHTQVRFDSVLLCFRVNTALCGCIAAAVNYMMTIGSQDSFFANE